MGCRPTARVARSRARGRAQSRGSEGRFEVFQNVRVDVAESVLAEDAVDVTIVRDELATIQRGAVGGGQLGNGLGRAARQEAAILRPVYEQRRDGQALDP